MLLQSEVVDDDGATWRLTREQVASRVVELVVAGHETTAKLIGNMVVALAWYPDARAELAADPSLVAHAVEEGLRWDGPSHYQGRWVERDVELHGVTIPADSRVVLLTGAASHDDRVFEHPELFDIHRDISRNLALGWGIHLCLGQALARLETRVADRRAVGRRARLRAGRRRRRPRAERSGTGARAPADRDHGLSGYAPWDSPPTAG